jgi:hypothetical protein
MKFGLIWILLLAAVCAADPVEDARKHADDHLRAAVEWRREDFAKTFVKEMREEYLELIRNSRNGCQAELFWIASQRRAEQGIRWKFDHGEEIGQDKIVLYYQPYFPGKRDVGRPLPVHCEKERDGWAIRSAQY